jgi:hypothetical protein
MSWSIFAFNYFRWVVGFSLCWCWWNCWPSLLSFSFHNIVQNSVCVSVVFGTRYEHMINITFTLFSSECKNNLIIADSIPSTIKTKERWKVNVPIFVISFIVLDTSRVYNSDTNIGFTCKSCWATQCSNEHMQHKVRHNFSVQTNNQLQHMKMTVPNVRRHDKSWW